MRRRAVAALRWFTAAPRVAAPEAAGCCGTLAAAVETAVGAVGLASFGGDDESAEMCRVPPVVSPRIVGGGTSVCVRTGVP